VKGSNIITRQTTMRNKTFGSVETKGQVLFSLSGIGTVGEGGV
jgi:hypothetical protein